MSGPRKSAGAWRKRQERDPYVRQARRDGWRSRAVFKLEQIVAKEPLLKPGMTCIDLGAAPGGWSQYVGETLKGRCRIIALDMLEMDALPGVEQIRGDFTEAETVQSLLERLGGKAVDLVMSDMAPNISGHKAVDQPRAMYLAELALELAKKVLKSRGDFICKLFQGQGADEFVREARKCFKRVRLMKPGASRAASSEVYLVARNYHL